LKELLSAVDAALERYGKNVSVILKPHPKENAAGYSDLAAGFKRQNLDIIIDGGSESFELIAVSDLVCGMSSMFLIESVILDKPTMSILVGLKRENPFILDRIGVLKSVLNREELNRKIESALSGGEVPKYNFNIVRGAAERVIGYMEAYLCQN